MNLSVKTVLRRMEAELAQVQVKSEKNDDFIRNIENIKLLSELLLEEYNREEQKDRRLKQIQAQTVHEKEINVEQPNVKQAEATSTYHEGTSIFDF